MSKNNEKFYADSYLIAFNSHWQASLILSVVMLSLAYLIFPVLSAESMIISALVQAFIPILILFGGVFALMAVSTSFSIRRAVSVRPSQPGIQHNISHDWLMAVEMWLREISDEHSLLSG